MAKQIQSSQFRMGFWHLLRAGVFCFFSVFLGKISAADDEPRQMQLVAYALHGNPNSADISPDEESVVTEVTRREETSDASTKRFLEVAQIWNFKGDKLLAELLLQQNDVKASATGYFPTPIRGESSQLSGNCDIAKYPGIECLGTSTKPQGRVCNLNWESLLHLRVAIRHSSIECWQPYDSPTITLTGIANS